MRLRRLETVGQFVCSSKSWRPKEAGLYLQLGERGGWGAILRGAFCIDPRRYQLSVRPDFGEVTSQSLLGALPLNFPPCFGSPLFAWRLNFMLPGLFVLCTQWMSDHRCPFWLFC